MLNFNAELIGSEDIKRNQRAAEMASDDGYFRRIFPPHEMFGAVDRAHSGSSFEYVVFKDAVDTSKCAGNLWIPRLWVYGRLEFTLHWGGPTGSTNPVRWNLVANSLALSENYTTGSQLSTTEDFAGPAVASTWKKNSFVSTLQVNADDELVGWTLNRLGTHANDTYANEAHLLAVVLKFIPAVTEAHRVV